MSGCEGDSIRAGCLNLIVAVDSDAKVRGSACIDLAYSKVESTRGDVTTAICVGHCELPIVRSCELSLELVDSDVKVNGGCTSLISFTSS